ncbi:hypothetical protein GEMRC1_002882 [Eukaryota sp. GEM-RC1]
MLKNLKNDDEKRQELGYHLYLLIEPHAPELAAKITGMFLALDDLDKIITIYYDEAVLHENIMAAQMALNGHSDKIQLFDTQVRPYHRSSHSSNLFGNRTGDQSRVFGRDPIQNNYFQPKEDSALHHLREYSRRCTELRQASKHTTLWVGSLPPQYHR